MCYTEVGMCADHNKWQPKENKMKAEYDILKSLALISINNDGACDEAILWYVKSCFGESDEKVLEKIIKEHPEWLDWCVEKGYIKKVERVPQRGEVWDCGGRKRLFTHTSEDGDEWYHFDTCKTGLFNDKDRYNGWKYIGKLKDLLPI